MTKNSVAFIKLRDAGVPSDILLEFARFCEEEGFIEFSKIELVWYAIGFMLLTTEQLISFRKCATIITGGDAPMDVKNTVLAFKLVELGVIDYAKKT